jgi:predicted MFS family arabinose efflux permease
VLIVPLGDLLERRTLVTRMVLLAAVALAVAAAAPSFAVLAVALMIAGLASVASQSLVPFASSLAGEAERGRVVGRVMSGLLIGILLARTLGGVVAGLGGWRLVFALAAGMMVLLAALLWRAMPASEPETALSYPELLRSVATLVRDEPVLRRRMALGLLGFAGFSVLWTSVAFLLSGPPFNYGEAAIGALGLAGLGGAVAASAAGRFADAGHGRAVQGVLLASVLASWGLLALGAGALVALVAGVVLLDFGMQGSHIINQSSIYALRPDARSRVTTAYMTSNFAGGALGSAAASYAWSTGGWDAVTGLGAAIAALGLVVWAMSPSRAAGESAPADSPKAESASRRRPAARVSPRR